MGKKTVALGIELSGSLLKVAVIDKARKNVLNIYKVSYEENLFLNPSLVYDWLNDFELSSGFKIGEVIISLSRSECFVKTIQVPVEEDDVSSYIMWELSLSLNSPVEDYIIDYDINSENVNSGFITAAVVAIRKEQLEKFYKEFSSVRPSIIEVDIYSVLNALEFSDPIVFSQHKLLIKADESEIQLARIQNGFINQFKTVPVKAYQPDMVEDSKNILMHKYCKELREAIIVMKSQNHDVPVESSILLCGEMSLEKEFMSILQGDTLEFELSRIDDFNGIELSPLVLSEGSIASFVGAIGAGLRKIGDKH